MKIAASIFKTFFLSLCIIANIHLALAQTASILPPAKTQFLDNNGKPLTSGTVDFYTGNVSSTTRKATWQNSGETVTNTNPVILDAGGRAIIYGDGSYRQVVKDRLGNLIWDQLTSSTGSGGSTPVTSTGDGDLVGTIKPWAGMTAPNQYVFTYGQELSRTTFAALFTAITSTQAVFCNSGSPILSGLADTTNFPIGASVELSCIAAGFSTIISKTSSTITLAANSNVTTNTNAIIFPWGNGNHSTTFNMPDLRGLTIVGNNNMGGVASGNITSTFYLNNPNSIGAVGGTGNHSLIAAENGPHSHAVFLKDNQHTHTTAPTTSTILNQSVAGSVAFGSGGQSTNSLAINLASSNITIGSVNGVANDNSTASQGAGQAFSIVQPSKTANYIIKVTPDANSATASGVTSLGGMTGSIACGNGLLCTGNIISVTTNSTDTLNYTIPYSGGITQSQTNYNKNIIYITDFGAVAGADTAGRNSTALTNAIAVCSTLGGAEIVVPIGTFQYANEQTIATNNCNLRGSGKASNLQYTGSGNAFNYSSNINTLYVQNLQLSATNTNARLIKASYLNNSVYFYNVYFNGGGIQVELTSQSTSVGGVYGVHFIGGECINASNVCIYVNPLGASAGLDQAIWIDHFDAEGYAQYLNITGHGNGIYVSHSRIERHISATNPDIVITNTSKIGISDNYIEDNGDTATISLGSGVDNVNINNNYFAVNVDGGSHSSASALVATSTVGNIIFTGNTVSVGGTITNVLSTGASPVWGRSNNFRDGTITGFVFASTAATSDFDINGTVSSLIGGSTYQVSPYTGTGVFVKSASPTFTGTPAAPTAASTTNTTQLATTAFVQQERRQVLGFASVNTGTASTTGFFTNNYSTTESILQIPMALAGTMKTARFISSTAPTSGQSYIFTVRKNGVDTALTATISNTNTSASDTTHSVTYAAGDLLTIKVVLSTTAAAAAFSAGLEYDTQ